ncbi:uncharacterized protein LOC110844742 isoform X2 [Folsomia candida]|uniref:uncharacterized protein LOC110844742 isoform X2 n=1 Tax=Folsomia candida TaxID=158441 RepID=UPI000B8F687D|nr:uncharacterized protein LOC110844742 isoform X2 [Folsomia candida]
MMELDPAYFFERDDTNFTTAINNENRNPKIQTRRLSDYSIILAPKPIPPPSRREDRQAARCRKSGMVPGAIRKYLLQKKKHEEEEEEDDDPTTSDIDGDDDADEGNNGQQVVLGEEQIVRRYSDDDDNDEEDGNGNEDEDDDGIQVVGVFNNHHHHYNNVLGEVNGGGGHVLQANGFPQDYESGSSDQEDNNNKNKRTYSSSFGLSPDTTTPEVNIASTSSIVRMSPHLEIHSSPVIIEVEQSPAEKRMRLERTPRKGGGCTSDSSSGHGGGVGRKSASAASSDVEGKGPKQPFCRQVLQDPPVVIFKQAPLDPDLEKKVRKNAWKDIITKFEINLNNKLVPQPQHVGDLIKKAILGLGTRVAKDIPTLAMDFFQTLVQKYPVSGGDETTQYYSCTFTQTSSDMCSMSEFLFDVLNRVQADAQARVQSKPFPFFKVLTKMVVQQYKDYGASQVKLRRPFFVQFLEEQDRILSYNLYCKKLVHFTFLLKDYPEEFKTVMRWVGLLAYHLKKHGPLDDEFRALVNDFADTLSRPEHSSSTSQIVQAVCDYTLGAAVSFKILTNRIKFESVKDNSMRPFDDDIAMYLRSLSKSDLITGLNLKERRHSNEYPTIPISSLVNVNGRKSETVAVNLKGESYLHKLCKKVSHDSKDSSSLTLAQQLKQQRFSTVNPTDNFGNTPLHDAIAHGRFDAVTKFYEFCTHVNLPEELRVNLLAQNEVGDTPFHLAAVSHDQSEQMSKLLCYMADNLQVKEEALKVLNHQGKMPYELAFNGNARTLLKPQVLTEWWWQLGDVSVHPSYRIELQSLDTKKLILFWSEFSNEEN